MRITVSTHFPDQREEQESLMLWGREKRGGRHSYIVEKWTRSSVSVSSDTILVKACVQTRHTMIAPQEDTREQRAKQWVPPYPQSWIHALAWKQSHNDSNSTSLGYRSKSSQREAWGWSVLMHLFVPIFGDHLSKIRSSRLANIWGKWAWLSQRALGPRVPSKTQMQPVEQLIG